MQECQEYAAHYAEMVYSMQGHMFIVKIYQIFHRNLNMKQVAPRCTSPIQYRSINW